MRQDELLALEYQGFGGYAGGTTCARYFTNSAVATAS